MNRKIVSHGRVQMPLHSFLLLEHFSNKKKDELINVPAQIENEILLFSIDRSMATYAKDQSLSQSELNSAARLMLNIMGSIGSAEDVIVSQNGRATLTISPEIREQIMSRFSSMTDFDESVANYIFDTISDGVSRTFRTQLSNVFVKTRLQDFAVTESQELLGTFSFDDIMDCFGFMNRLYRAFLKSIDITTAVNLMRDFSSNRLFQNVSNLTEMLFESDGYSVNVRVADLIDDIKSKLIDGETYQLVVESNTPIMRCNVNDLWADDVQALTIPDMYMGLVDLAERWANGRIIPTGGDFDPTSFAYRFASPYGSNLGEQLSYDLNALLPYLQRGSTDKGKDTFNCLFMDRYAHNLIGLILRRDTGAFSGQVQGIMNERKNSTETIFEPTFRKQLNFLSQIREAYVITFGQIWALVSDPTVFFPSITPYVRQRITDTMDTFINSWQTFTSQTDDVRYPRSLSLLISNAVYPKSALVSGASLLVDVGFDYRDSDLNSEQLSWLRDIRTGEKTAYVATQRYLTPRGHAISSYRNAPIDDLKPYLLGWYTVVEPYYFIRADHAKQLTDFPLIQTQNSLIPLRRASQLDMVHTLMSSGYELKIFTSLSDMSMQLRVPVEWLRGYLSNLGGEWNEAWLVNTSFKWWIVFDRHFKLYEVGEVASNDAREWPFIANYPAASEWTDMTYVVSNEYDRMNDASADPYSAFQIGERGGAPFNNPVSSAVVGGPDQLPSIAEALKPQSADGDLSSVTANDESNTSGNAELKTEN